MAVSSSQSTTIGYGATPTNFANVSSIQGPNPTAEEIDVTALDSTGGYREFLQSFKDGGEITVEMFVDPVDSGYQYLWTSFNAGTVEDWTITLPDTSTIEISGYISGAPGVNATVGDAITASMTIRCTGAPTLTWSA